MAVNPNDHSIDQVNKPNRTEYDRSKCNNFSGQVGQLLPFYFSEVTIGDTVELSPNVSLRFAPTVQPLLTRMKCVMDFFFVPLQAVWSNSPLFFNVQQNNVGPVPEVPYMKIPDYAGYFNTGSLSDYLGVPTSLAGYSMLPVVQDFNISFDSQSCYYGITDLQNPAGQDIWQTCYFGAYDSTLFAAFASESAANARYVYPGDGAQFMNQLYSYHRPKFLSALPQIANYDLNDHEDSLGAVVENAVERNRVYLYSINDSFLAHLTDQPYLYGLVSCPLFVGAMTKIHRYNESSLVGRLSGRFQLRNGILSAYAPNSDTDGLYVVLVCTPQQSVWHPSRRWSADVGYEPGGARWSGNAPNPFIAAYAVPSEVQVNVVDSVDSPLVSAEVILSSSALANFNGAIAELEKHKAQLGKYELQIGFFTHYPAGSYDDNQGYFSLPQNQNVSESRYNSAHPAEISYTFDGFATGVYDPQLDPNIKLDIPRFYTKNNALGDIHFYEYLNCLGLSVSYLCSPATVVEADLISNRLFGSVNDAAPVKKLNAFRWRTYECAYNFFYRNRDLDPLLDLQGHRIINKYLRDDQMADGADTNQYPMRYCLLEKDQFTSCLTEPLVNFAPLVGLREKDNRNVILDFAAHDGVSSVMVGLETDTAGNPYAKTSVYAGSIPEDAMSILRDVINQGISLHDIHNVESLTRWISNHVEHGYNSADQQLASFGVGTDWNPMTQPIYLGGCSELIKNGTVVAQDSEALGSMAGTLTAYSTNERTIKYFCRERGFVIGIMRVVPIPVYPSALPLDMQKFDPFQFYTPEYDRKGWEPVYYDELCPLMSSQSQESGKQLGDIFGWNVPWHDYKFDYDEMHGDVRLSFNNAVLYREFGEIPVLGRSFIQCNPLDYNNVFQNESPLDDKFIAQIFTSARYLRPISNPQTRVF